MFYYLEFRIFRPLWFIFTFNYLMSGYFDDTFSEFNFQCSIDIILIIPTTL